MPRDTTLKPGKNFTGEQQESPRVSPVDEFYEWLRQDEPSAFEWDCDEGGDRWREFLAEEDLHAWLYFYRPDANADFPQRAGTPLPTISMISTGTTRRATTTILRCRFSAVGSATQQFNAPHTEITCPLI